MKLIWYELRKLCMHRLTLAILALLLVANASLVIRNAYTPISTYYTYCQADVAAFYTDRAGMTADQVIEELEAWQESYDNRYWIDDDGNVHLPTQEQLDALLRYFDTTGEENEFNQLMLEKVSVIADYESYLDYIDQEAGRMLRSSLFSQPNSFSYRNIIRTQAAYVPMRSTVVTLADSSGVKLALEPYITTVCLLFAAMLLGLNLLMNERELGLFALIKPTRQGRLPTIAAKLGAMALALLALTLLFYGENLLIGGSLFGLGDLSRSIQSLDGYSTSFLSLSVGNYLVLFLAGKYLALLAVSLLFFTICLGAKRIITARLIACGILLGELGLYWSIDIHSYLSPLRQINFVSLLDTMRFFDDYRNMNLFGLPCNTILVGLVTAGLLLVLLSLFCCLRWQRDDPIVALRQHGARQHRSRISVNLLEHEGFKLLVTHRGALILALFLLLQLYSYSDTRLPVGEDELYYQQFCEVLTGDLTQEKLDWMEETQSYYSSLNEQQQEIWARADAGEISSGYAGYLVDLITPSVGEQKAYLRLTQQWSYLMEQIDQGKTVQFVSDTGYGYLLEPDSNDVLDAGKLGFVLAVGLAALFPYEHTTQMVTLIRPSVRGAKAVRRRKLLSAGGYTLCAWLIAVLPHIYTVLRLYLPEHWSFSAPSLTYFANAPDGCSILGWYLLLLLVRLGCALLAAGGILFIGAKTRNTVTTLLIGLIVLELPVALYLLGAPGEWLLLGFQTGHSLLA